MARKPTRSPKDYEVGYGKPPEHSRFRPGQSGNARGRPKGSANFDTLLLAALNKLVPVKEGGRRRHITKAEAIVTQLVNKAANADIRAIRLILGLRPAQGSGASASAADVAEEPVPDFEGMTTDELATIYEAALILEGKRERPPVPVPPGGPKKQNEAAAIVKEGEGERPAVPVPPGGPRKADE